MTPPTAGPPNPDSSVNARYRTYSSPCDRAVAASRCTATSAGARRTSRAASVRTGKSNDPSLSMAAWISAAVAAVEAAGAWDRAAALTPHATASARINGVARGITRPV